MPRHHLDDVTLLALFSWDEKTFLKKTEGTAIRRIGHERWLRNIAVVLGNSLATADEKIKKEIIQVLRKKLDDTPEVVKEHIIWALKQA